MLPENGIGQLPAAGHTTLVTGADGIGPAHRVEGQARPDSTEHAHGFQVIVHRQNWPTAQGKAARSLVIRWLWVAHGDDRDSLLQRRQHGQAETAVGDDQAGDIAEPSSTCGNCIAVDRSQSGDCASVP